MKIKPLDGVPPFYSLPPIDWTLIFFIEILTIAIEFVFIYLYSEHFPKEKRWTPSELFEVTFAMNIVSFLMGLMIYVLYTSGRLGGIV